MSTQDLSFKFINSNSENLVKIRHIEPDDVSKYMKLASISSWIVNWFLLFIKIYVVIHSGSKAVTAALADSAGITLYNLKILL